MQAFLFYEEHICTRVIYSPQFRHLDGQRYRAAYNPPIELSRGDLR